MRKLLIIGSIHVDYLNHVYKLPKGNEEMETTDNEMRIIGGGYKSAYLYQKLGFDYETVLPIGTGIYGDACREQLVKDEIHAQIGEREEMDGCSITLIDRDGKEARIGVNGAEYDLQPDDFQSIDEFDPIVVFGDVVKEENEKGLLSFLKKANKPITFVPSGRMNEIKYFIDEVMKLNPFLIVSDLEAYTLEQGKSDSLQTLASSLYNRTHNGIIIYQQSSGIFVKNKEDEFAVESESYFDPDLLTAGYLIGATIGVNIRSSASYGLTIASKYHDHLPDEMDMQVEKVKVAGLITGK